MATRAGVQQPHPEWQRVAALSASFFAHAVAAMALAAPLTIQVPRIEAHHVVASLIEEPPPLPPPPEQQPPPRVPVHRTTPQRPPVAPPVPAPSVIEVPPTPAPVEAVPVQPVAPVTTGIAEGPAIGETRRLAYDGALALKYPPTALRLRQQGRVLLDVLVDASGNVQRIEIARSSGHAELDTAAREAVLRTHFKPVLRDGRATAAWGVVPIEFRLDRA